MVVWTQPKKGEYGLFLKLPKGSSADINHFRFMFALKVSVRSSHIHTQAQHEVYVYDVCQQCTDPHSIGTLYIYCTSVLLTYNCSNLLKICQQFPKAKLLNPKLQQISSFSVLLINSQIYTKINCCCYSSIRKKYIIKKNYISRNAQPKGYIYIHTHTQ